MDKMCIENLQLCLDKAIEEKKKSILDRGEELKIEEAQKLIENGEELEAQKRLRTAKIKPKNI